jgi:hypothetical protein
MTSREDRWNRGIPQIAATACVRQPVTNIGQWDSYPIPR